MIIGPISPTRFIPASTKAPEPDLSVNPEWTIGQLLQCLQTGRIWVVGTANGTLNQQVRQVLPWVRQPVATPTVGTQIVNNGGSMKVQKEVTAGVTFGEFDMFNALKVNSNGEIIVPGFSGIACFDETNTLNVPNVTTFIVEDSDETLSTNPSAPTVLYHVNQDANGWIQPVRAGKYLLTTTRQFYHNNAYVVHMAIEYTPNIPIGGSTYYPLIYHSQTSPPGGGYMSMTLTAIADLGGSQGWFRIAAWASEAGVVHRPNSGVNQWRSNPVSPNAGYQTQSRSNMLGIQVA